MNIVARLEEFLSKPLDIGRHKSIVNRVTALVLYTMYYNALRVSEAVECIAEYLRYGYTEVLLKAKKRGGLRRCFIPKEITDNLANQAALRLYFKRHGWDLERIAHYIVEVANRRGLRTHDYRRMAIWEMYDRYGLPLDVIAEVTGHKKSYTITEYYIKPVLEKFIMKGEKGEE